MNTWGFPVHNLSAVPGGKLETIQEPGDVHGGLDALDYLHIVVQKLNVTSNALDVVHHAGEDLVDVPGVVAHAGDTQGQKLPEVVVVYLGDGDVEATTHTGADGTQGPTLPF